jgi:2-polyprenyl-3-methyl-5-hydroxy-6-metoxy-1,4-benzoquinol methylase
VNGDSPACPLCGHAPTCFLFKNTDFLFRTTPKTFQLFRCSCCGAAFLHPFPTEEELPAAYPEKYWWSGGKQAGLGSRLEQAYRELVLRHHVAVARRHFPRPSPRVLDIGCGSGSFLHVLARRTGIRGEGLEISVSAAAAAREQYGLTVRAGDVGTADFPEGAFDFIVIFHVVEHLARPREALAKVSRWLAPGGVLLVQVPNLASWQFRWFGRRWTGIDIPRHLINYTPGCLAGLLRDAGLEPGKPSFFSLRDNAPAMISSLCPGLDPMALHVRGARRFAFFRKILYLVLVLAAQPLAAAEALAGRGGTMFMAATKH